MKDTITIPRESAETLIKLATRVLDMTEETGPERLERAEVTMMNNQRNRVKEAVYQTEKAIYEGDRGSMPADTMRRNAERMRHWEDACSDDKTAFIEGRRR